MGKGATRIPPTTGKERAKEMARPRKEKEKAKPQLRAMPLAKVGKAKEKARATTAKGAKSEIPQSTCSR